MVEFKGSVVMKKIFIVVFVLIGTLTLRANADVVYKDVDKFRRYNPDGKKYEFVKDYLTGLHYLKLNLQRKNEFRKREKGGYQDSHYVKGYIDNLKMNNVNLRVARNLIRKYRTPENGLILQVQDFFTKACNEQIAINNDERKLFEKLYTAHLEGLFDDFDKEGFLKKQVPINSRRKESKKILLEASLLIGKVLVSDRMDRFGDLSFLGITQKQKENLLLKIDEFYGDGFEGELREGQTFLEASISAIREILEDRSFQLLDD